MHHATSTRQLRGIRHQAGLTLIEFMVSIVIGMIMIAALATLIANQSSNRAEIDKSGKMIENGRYAIQTLATDLQMAGYWGELSGALAAAALPDPCSTAVADLQDAMALHVQGYDAPATLPLSLQVCVKNHKPGTDVLVVRRADPDTSDIETAGVADWAKVAARPGQVYLQTGMDASGVQFGTPVIQAATNDAAANHTTFPLTKKDKVTPASPRKYIVHIYYVSKCSVEVGGSCTSADGGTPIPTLKRVELSAAGGVTAFSTITIAEGIENFQVDYGVDTDNDGSPNGTDNNGSGLTKDTWPDVMTVNLHLLARGLEKAIDFTDTKVYAMGTAGAASAAVSEQGYKRHVFVQSVRLVNPAGRRAL